MNKPLLNSIAWLLSLCLLFLLTFTSCQQGDEPAPTEKKANTCRINKFYNAYDTTEYTTFHFDGQNRLFQTKDYYVGNLKATSTYEYNSLGQVSKVTVIDRYLVASTMWIEQVSCVYTFEYNALGQVTKFITRQGRYENPPESVTLCEYDAAGNRIRTINTPPYANNDDFISSYIYVNGNCVKAVSYQGLQIETSKEYTFDLSHEDKQRSFNQFYLPYLLGQTPNKNIPTFETYTSKQFAYSRTYNYQDEYNENGFITKHTIVQPDNSIVHSTITKYDCNN